MSSWSKYPWIALVAARSNLAYIGDVSSRFLFLGIVLYIFTCLWKTTFAASHSDSLGGFTLSQMLWYLVITESIMLSATRVSQQVDEDVRTGALAVQLVRPISYPVYRLCATIGERVVRFLMNLLVGAIVVLLLVGPLTVTSTGLLLFVLALPLAFVMDFLCNFLIGLGAFWLEDTSGLFLLYSRITMIVGGMLMPIELMPEFVRPLIKALPFASIVYGPAKLFVLPSTSDFGQLLLHQCVTAAVLTVIVALVYNRALRRVFANGG